MLSSSGIGEPHAHDESPYAELNSRNDALRFGMWVFLGSETLLFAGLFGLYTAYRVMYPAEFARASHQNEQWIGTVNTVVLIVSSFCAAFAVQVGREARARSVRRALLSVIFLGLVFLGLKSLEYTAHFHEGIAPGALYQNEALPDYGARVFFTLYYFMTGLHALHVIAGLALMTWLLFRVRSDALLATRHIELELCALYWHLVDIVWIFLWPLLYLIA